MKLDVVNSSVASKVKWLGLYEYDKVEPPKPGDVLDVSDLGKVRVIKCSAQKTPRGKPPTRFTVVVTKI